MGSRLVTRILSGPADPPGSGDYLTDGRELYRVEQVKGHQALVEDCRTGNLIDVPLEELAALEPVSAGRQAEDEHAETSP